MHKNKYNHIFESSITTTTTNITKMINSTPNRKQLEKLLFVDDLGVYSDKVSDFDVMLEGTQVVVWLCGVDILRLTENDYNTTIKN